MSVELTITNPETLTKDPDSKAFYILKDESIALCKHLDELPYHKKRSTYLSSGRFSPQYRVVVFWPGSINPKRAYDLLIENNIIEADFTFKVSGATTKVKGEPKKATNSGIDRHDRVRQAAIHDMIKKGFRIQGDKSQEVQPDGAQTDQG